jgi:hypothetical protein
MRSLFAPLKLDADSKELHFVTEFDRTIDDVRFFPQICTGDHVVTVYGRSRVGPSFLCWVTVKRRSRRLWPSMMGWFWVMRTGSGRLSPTSRVTHLSLLLRVGRFLSRPNWSVLARIVLSKAPEARHLHFPFPLPCRSPHPPVDHTATNGD